MSNNRPTQEVDIPTSTVVAIGGGFIILALSFVGLLIVIRLLRLSQEVKRRTREGETGLTVRGLWVERGGFWGYGRGARGLNDHGLALGAGGGMTLHPDQIRRHLIWQQLAMMDLDGGGAGAAKDEDGKYIVPELWEVGFGEKEDRVLHAGEVMEDEDFKLSDLKPVSVITSTTPDSDTDQASIDPTIDLTVLILLPAPEGKAETGIDGSEDLPEMVTGSTQIWPMILEETDPHVGYGDGFGVNEKEGLRNVVHIEHGKGTKGDVVHLEYERKAPERRAKWIKTEDRWHIEHLG